MQEKKKKRSVSRIFYVGILLAIFGYMIGVVEANLQTIQITLLVMLLYMLSMWETSHGR